VRTGVPVSLCSRDQDDFAEHLALFHVEKDCTGLRGLVSLCQISRWQYWRQTDASRCKQILPTKSTTKLPHFSPCILALENFLGALATDARGGH
jgi:hypothetical protein